MAALIANGGNLSGTAKKLGVPRNSLRVWFEEDQQEAVRKANESPEEAKKEAEARAKLPGLSVSELRQQKKESLANAFTDIIWRCILRLDQSDIIDKTTRPTDLSTVAGTFFDKVRLLQGESTAIVETKLANHRWAEEELQKLMREHKLTREEALKIVKEGAPTWAEMLM